MSIAYTNNRNAISKTIWIKKETKLITRLTPNKQPIKYRKMKKINWNAVWIIIKNILIAILTGEMVIRNV